MGSEVASRVEDAVEIEDIAGEGGSNLDLPSALKELARVRSEVDTRQAQAQELEAKVETVEALRAEQAKNRETFEAKQRGLLVENVALRHSLPDDLAALLKGETREELNEHAKVLKKYAGPKNDVDSDPEISGGLNPGAGDRFDPFELGRSMRWRRSS